jgi:glycosyltransferase involved in cell wall biosynthesis
MKGATNVREIKVSVILPMYNGSQYINLAIQSVLGQTYDNYEIVLVNDGSTDNSKKIIEPYIGKPYFVYIEKNNSGVAAARNVGILASTGDVVAFLDQDDVWVPSKLEMQVKFLLANPSVGMVHGNIKYIDADGRSIANKDADWVTNASGWCFDYLFKSNRIAIATACVWRSCIDSIGRLREDVSGVDDYEYWLRLSMRWPIGHINECLAYYRLHSNNESKNWLSQDIKLAATLDGIAANFPASLTKLDRSIIASRMLPIYGRIVKEYYRTNQHKQARLYLIESIKLRPLTPIYYVMVCMGLFSPRIRVALRWYLKKFSNYVRMR